MGRDGGVVEQLLREERELDQGAQDVLVRVGGEAVDKDAPPQRRWRRLEAEEATLERDVLP